MANKGRSRQKRGTGSYIRKNGMIEYRVSMGTRADGSRWRQSFYGKTEREAREKYEDWMKESDYTPIERVVTVKEWAEKWLEHYKGHLKNTSYKSYKNYELYVTKHIIPVIGKLALKDVRPVHIISLLNKKSSLSKSALKYIEICLNGIFKKAVENRLCVNNPVNSENFISKNKQKKKPTFFSVEELSKIFNFAPNHENGNIVMALLYTGVREGELAALMHGDNHADEAYIVVDKTITEVENDDKRTITVGGKEKHRKKYDIKYTPKNGEERMVALTPTGIEFFKSLPQNNSRFIFPSSTGSFMTPNQLRWKYTKFINDLNKDLDRQKEEFLEINPDSTEDDIKQFEHVRNLSPHKCRHTYGSRSVASGINLRTIQEQLGHKQITTTQIYTQNPIEDRKKSMSKFSY